MEADFDMSESKPDMSVITHHICDRPVLRQRLANVVYIQPQWVFDSINKGSLEPANLYLPGEKLPPHLSPWGDAIGYDPTASPASDEEEASDEENVEDEIVDEDEDVVAQKELEQEAQGVYKDTSNADEDKKSKKKAKSAEEEERAMKMVMMSNKQKKLYTKMQYSNKQKDDEIKKLKKRKQQLEGKRK